MVNTTDSLLAIGLVGAGLLAARAVDLGGLLGGGGSPSGPTEPIANPDRTGGVNLETGFPGTSETSTNDTSGSEQPQNITVNVPTQTPDAPEVETTTPGDAFEDSDDSDGGDTNADTRGGVDLETGFQSGGSNNDDRDADSSNGVDLNTGFAAGSGSDDSGGNADTSGGVDLDTGFSSSSDNDDSSGSDGGAPASSGAGGGSSGGGPSTDPDTTEDTSSSDADERGGVDLSTGFGSDDDDDADSTNGVDLSTGFGL